jgi:hypothetical protein
MSKYASILFEPSKFHQIGPFRFPIYNDLVPGEAKGIEEIGRKQSKSTFRSIKLAQRIAKDKGITTKEAVNLLGEAGNDENQEILFDYATDLEELQRDTLGATEQQIAFVTLFIRYRGEVKLPRTKDWTRLSDWTDEDTESMPSKTMEDVFKLLTWERDGWPEPEAEGNDEEQEFSPPPNKS